MNIEQLKKLAEERVVQADLFTFSNVVIPIKTGGRWYGAISQYADELGVPFPDLSLCASKVVPYKGNTYVFVALWSDTSTNTPEHIFECACSALLAASHAHLKTLAMPLLGGKDGTRFIGSMERAINHIEDTLEPTGILMPEVTFVTR